MLPPLGLPHPRKTVRMKTLLTLAVLSLVGADGLRGAPTAEAPAPEPSPTRLVISGSSTVAPFALVLSTAVEELAFDVNPSGTTAGLAALCDLHPGSADLTGASRPIRTEELADCAAADVSTVVEVPLGRDGIVLAQRAGGTPLPLTPHDIYRALAASVPNENCAMLPNKARRWADIRADLPDRRITVFGPPRTSGTRDEFIERAVLTGARDEPCLAALERSDPRGFRDATALRRDGAWVEAGESDGAIAYALTRLPAAIGVFGLVHAAPQDDLELLPFGGVHPNAQTVADGRYPMTRPLFLYTTAGHLTRDARVIGVVRGFTAPEATGPSGQLTRMGLAPGPETGRAHLIDTRTGERTPLPLGR